MKTVYLTIRVDFDTDNQEQADQWATTLKLMDEREHMNRNCIDNIEVCGINEDL